MPREGKVSITVDVETRDMLRRNKPDGVTWDRYFEVLQYGRDLENEHLPEDYKERVTQKYDGNE